MRDNAQGLLPVHWLSSPNVVYLLPRRAASTSTLIWDTCDDNDAALREGISLNGEVSPHFHRLLKSLMKLTGANLSIFLNEAFFLKVKPARKPIVFC